MASKKLKTCASWLITLNSKRNMSNRDRDFIAELVSEEARTVIEFYGFILHDIIESKRYSKMLIEGKKSAINNLLSVIKDNLPYRVSYLRI